MVPINFRLGEKDEKEYINQVLNFFSDAQKEESIKKIQEFLAEIQVSGTLKKKLDLEAQRLERDYSGFGYLCMWLVMPYEEIRELKLQTDFTLMIEFAKNNPGIKKYIGMTKWKSFCALQKKINKKMADGGKKNLWAVSGTVLEKYNDLHTYFMCFNKRYKNFSKQKINQWIVEVTGLEVCPYCNISYTYNRENNATAQLDHFFPESEYPMFSICFYNLIPSCPSCNRLKSNKLVEFASPYKKDAFQTMGIKWCFSGRAVDQSQKALEKMIKLKVYSPEADERNNIKEFQLEAAYEHHRDYASEMIRKAEIYLNKDTQKLLMSVMNYGGNNILTSQEIERIYFSNYLQEEKIGKRSLAKMAKDIFEDLQEQQSKA